MQISTRTVIVLDESDITQAIIAFVKAQNLVAEDQPIDIELKIDPIAAVLSVATDSGGSPKVTIDGKPKTRGKARAKDAAPAAPEGNQGKEALPAGDGSEGQTEERTSEAPVAEQLPWDGDEGDAEDETKTEKEETVQTTVATPIVGNSIFPNANSSAAPSTKPAPVETTNVKSLFANLKSPTQ